VFDSEVVGRAISKMPVPVITGLGHEVDRTIADEAAAISEKTPSAVGEWLVARVKDFSDRLGRARLVIGTEARSAFQRHRQRLVSAAGTVASVSTSLARQRDLIDHVKGGIADSARRKLQGEERNISNLGEWFSAIGLNATLGRGFAVVTKPDGRTVIRSVDQVSAGDSLVVRVGDGTFPVKVEGQ
jgi:exodeoxyribonuclease VII large subunit